MSISIKSSSTKEGKGAGSDMRSLDLRGNTDHEIVVNLHFVISKICQYKVNKTPSLFYISQKILAHGLK